MTPVIAKRRDRTEGAVSDTWTGRVGHGMADVQRLVAQTLSRHASGTWGKAKAPAGAAPSARPSSAGPSAAQRAPAPAPSAARGPARADRDNFMSSDVSRVHDRSDATAGLDQPPTRAGRGGSANSFNDAIREVERLGGARLKGLSKIDQKVRERKQLGLRPEKGQKRPYPQLVALRKKQRAQDEDAARLAKQAGMKERRSTVGQRHTAPQVHNYKSSNATPRSLGDALHGGVLHVSSATIKGVQWRARAGRGGGRGGKGGRGKGGRGGRGTGRGRGGGGRGGRGPN